MKDLVCIVKVGVGIEAAKDDLLKVHYRCANELVQFNSDNEVDLSTYRTGIPDVIYLNEDYLKECVYSALIGQCVGSTIQVRDESQYIEIWIEDIVDKSSERILLSEQTVERPMTGFEKYLEFMEDPKKQKNGYYVSIPEALYKDFEAALKEYASSKEQFRQPAKTGEGLKANTVGLVFEEEAFQKILQLCEGGACE